MEREFTTGITVVAPYYVVSMVAGPDGNMWFTEDSKNTVGRITNSGSVTEFVTGILGTNMRNIVVNPDQNLVHR